jgi:hypothetical protein
LDHAGGDRVADLHKSVGVVRVVSLTATATGVELVRITSDRKSSNSLAN